jgi:hypothetical protein
MAWKAAVLIGAAAIALGDAPVLSGTSARSPEPPAKADRLPASMRAQISAVFDGYVQDHLGGTQRVRWDGVIDLCGRPREHDVHDGACSNHVPRLYDYSQGDRDRRLRGTSRYHTMTFTGTVGSVTRSVTASLTLK